MTCFTHHIFYAVLLLFASCTSHKSVKPKLVVLLVVDHMRPDLITRFDDLYTGGFRWLIDHGVWFTDAHHEHSYTATGPGHTAISFGQHPGKVGVIGNSYYDRNLKKRVNCVEDPMAKVVGSDFGDARSFSRYNATGIGDWLKQKHPRGKVISIGGKDRTACILGGKNPDLALYYNRAGSFITSDYYTDTLPVWVHDYNKRLQSTAYSDSIWRKSLDEELYNEYARNDFYYGEEDNFLNETYSPVFPIGIDSTFDAFSQLMGRPWFEREVLDLAKMAVKNDSLGIDSEVDLLAIGFSAMDWMLHDYGPFSQEAMDACIKLDQYLGDFFDFLEENVGLDNILFVLTADHGGLPLPEYVVEQGGSGGRINRAHMKEALTWIDEECDEVFGENVYHREGANFFIDIAELKKKNINHREIYEITEKYLKDVDGINSVIIKEDVLKSEENDDLTIRLKNMIHPIMSPEISPLVAPGYLYRSPFGTSHGSPYDYDTHVPLIFARSQINGRKDMSRKATVDIAPTIASYLKIPIPESCDGSVIKF